MKRPSLQTWARLKSPWILHFNTGACNACDIEVVDLLTPRFDVEQYGVKLQGSPRHADILVVTGSVTRQTAPRLKRIYDQMPSPKHVLVVGTCGTSGAPFQECYNVCGGADTVIPVDMYVPGCPPHPEAIIDGVVKLLQKIQQGGDQQ